jgi:hypothetical protein
MNQSPEKRPDDLRISIIYGENGKSDLVEIRRVGNPDNVYYKITEKEDFLRNLFPTEFAAYLKRKENPDAPVRKAKPKGTNLLKIDGMSKSRIDLLKRHEVETVEQLAVLSDVSCNGIGTDYLELRKNAQRYLNELAGQFPRQVVG